ncbi:MAG TPA: MFS transporter [Acetobacteraceae bacterium]|nr:MFS transporter [Acetobacteraceae bacterium]
MSASVRQQRDVVIACYLGWTLDAFDFFIMAFVLGDVAQEFGTGVTAVSFAVLLTLAMRMLGALIFGRIADRYGRRPALMASILGYSLFGFASGLAPSLTVFLILRALFGIAMGGEWGVGASLTMESIPPQWRGRVSGLLQAGYPSGYLLASVLYGLVHTWAGWRGMFMMGAVPALLVFYIRSHVPESPDWEHRDRARRSGAAPTEGLVAVIRRHAGLTVHAVLLMTAFNFFSHGTQDIYPRFLQAGHHITGWALTAIAVTYNIGAILGGLVFGTVSEWIGRRRAIGLAALLALPVVPLWAFTGNPLLIGAGAFLMQFAVQGAWGVVPAHLNELSPPEIRATFPGLTYQLGNLIAAVNLPLQSGIADRLGGDYRWPLAGVAVVAAVAILLLVASGREARGVRMGHEA